MKKNLLFLFFIFLFSSLRAQETIDQLLTEANTKLQQSDPKSAIHLLRMIAQKDSGRFETFSYLGAAYIKIKKLDSALFFYNRAIQIGNNQPDLYFNRSRIFIFKGEYKNAINDLRKAISISPDNSDYHILAGFIYDEQKEYTKAIQSYRIAHSLTPEQTDLCIAIELAELKIRCISLPKNKSHKILYESFLANKYEETIDESRKIIKEIPNDQTALEFSVLLKIALGRPAEAILECNKLILITPASTKNYYYRALAKIAFNQLEESIDDLKKYTSTTPTDTLGQYLLAYSCYKTQAYPEAVIAYNSLLKMKPKNPTLLLNRGNVYVLMGVYPRALEDFNTIITTRPEWTMGYLSRGLTYMKMNSFSEACADFKKALELGNTSAEELIKQLCDKK